ncbi:MAG: hypothetical protein HY390_03935 [Deltaproteobacteria bacterium]|nr:hypothetical protein [Deltaproteobacteria bacterium]
MRRISLTILICISTFLFYQCGGGGDKVGSGESGVDSTAQSLSSIQIKQLMVEGGASIELFAEGGAAPYRFSLAPDAKGSINAEGHYFAPPAGENTVITVTDSTGKTVSIIMIFSQPLSIDPASSVLEKNGEIIFKVNGGFSPYVFSTDFGSVVQDTGKYTAPNEVGSAFITVTDFIGNSVKASLEIVAPLEIISNGDMVMGVGATKQIQVTGGVSPYTFSVDIGSIDQQGNYTAPLNGGSAMITVNDEEGRFAQVQITIHPLVVESTFSEILVKNQRTFTASGGTPPYIFSTSLGRINANSGVYTAPDYASETSTATITVTDSIGVSVSTNVDIRESLVVQPTHKRLMKNMTELFFASFGKKPYTFSMRSGYGSIDQYGNYTAPDRVNGTGIDRETIMVTDANGDSAVAFVTVVDTLSISPQNITLEINSTKSFQVTGGALPYTYITTFGTIDSSGYRAPSHEGSGSLTVRDADGNRVTASIFVVLPLKINPGNIKTILRNGVKQFSANGGVPPYQYSVSHGNISSSGSYQAPNTLLSAVSLTATDARGQVATVLFNIVDVMQISVGAGHSCALFTDGSLKCWGNNKFGQLGNSNPSSRLTPTTVENVEPIKKISASFNSTAAVSMDGKTLWYWGTRSYKSGTMSVFSTPVVTPTKFSVSSGVFPFVFGILKIGVGSGHTCVSFKARNNENEIECWGSNYQGQLGQPPTADNSGALEINDYLQYPNTNYAAGLYDVAAGQFHTCAISSYINNRVACWGDNTYGQLGRGYIGNTSSVNIAYTNNSTPNLVSFMEPQIQQISLGANHTCALLSSQTVKCWGINYNGQVGTYPSQRQDDPFSVAKPITVPKLNDVIQISAGRDHTCALLSNRAVKCWGNNLFGQLGLGNNFLEKAYFVTNDVLTLSDVEEVAAGGGHTCARLRNNVVKCWGENSHGQLGDGSQENRLTPVEVQFD